MIKGLSLRGLWVEGKSQAQEDKQARAVAGESGMGEDEPASWVRVATVDNPVHAVITVARLQDEGIPARTQREAISQAIPVAVGPLAEINILVPESMLEKARLILEREASPRRVSRPKRTAGIIHARRFGFGRGGIDERQPS
jgi:hypothetical protein